MFIYHWPFNKFFCFANKRARFIHGRNAVTAKPLWPCSEVKWIVAEIFHKRLEVVVVRLLHKRQGSDVEEHSAQCFGNVVTLEDVLFHARNCFAFQARCVTQPWESSTYEIPKNIDK